MVETPVAEVQKRLQMVAKEDGDLVEVLSFPDYTCLRIPEARRHFWSPRLNLSMSAAEAGKTRIEGTYGPNGNVWALYLYGYLILGMGGTFAGILGFVQRALGKTPWGLWIFGAALVLALAMYVLAQFGQKLAMMHTFQIHQAYEKAVGTHVEIH